MSYDNHLAALEAKHAQVQSRIDQEYTKPYPDTQHLKKLKLRKLRLKREIVSLRPRTPANANQRIAVGASA